MRTHDRHWIPAIRIHYIRVAFAFFFFFLFLPHYIRNMYKIRVAVAIFCFFVFFFFRKCKTAVREYLSDSVQSMSLEPVRVGAKYFFVYAAALLFTVSPRVIVRRAFLLFRFFFFFSFFSFRLLSVFVFLKRNIYVYFDTQYSKWPVPQTFPVLPN